MQRAILYFTVMLGGCGEIYTNCSDFDEGGRKNLLSQQFMLNSIPDESENIQCHEINWQDTARFFAFSADRKKIDAFIMANFPTLDVTSIDKGETRRIDMGADLDWWIDDSSKIDYHYISNRNDYRVFELYISEGQSRDRIWGYIIERR